MRLISRLFVLVALTLSALPAPATSLLFDVTGSGSGGRYEYSYSLTNDSLGVPIAEFTVFFPFGLFANLQATSAPTDWDGLVVEPVEILGNPVDGFYDALALSAPLFPGQTVAGFRVAFDWLGADVPGPQRFEIVDPETFEVLDSGTTQLAAAVPEPGAFLLLAIGLAVVVGAGSTASSSTRRHG